MSYICQDVCLVILTNSVYVSTKCAPWRIKNCTHKRGFAQVAKDGSNWMEWVELALENYKHQNLDEMIFLFTPKWSLPYSWIDVTRTHLSFTLELDARAEFSEQYQVEDDGWSKKRVLTSIVQHDCVFPSQEYLRGVLIHCPLAVPHIRHILNKTWADWVQVIALRNSLQQFYQHFWMAYLNNNNMIRVLSGLIEDAVAANHVIHHIAFRNLLGPESLGRWQIHAVVVPQVVIAYYWCWLPHKNNISNNKTKSSQKL